MKTFQNSLTMTNLITELKNYPKTWGEFERYCNGTDTINDEIIYNIFTEGNPAFVGLREALEDFLDAKGVYVEVRYQDFEWWDYFVLYMSNKKSLESIDTYFSRSEASNAAVIEAFKYLEGK